MDHPSWNQQVTLMETVLDQRSHTSTSSPSNSRSTVSSTATSTVTPTSRLAIVNLDWDHVTLVDLMKVLDSMKPSGSQLTSLVQYVSKFGRTRMAYENLHGPLFDLTTPSYSGNENHPQDIHELVPKKPLSSTQDEVTLGLKEQQQQHQKEEEEEDQVQDQDENTDTAHADKDILDDDEDTPPSVSNEVIRKYELEKLRYYYVIVTCDSVTTATSLLQACDGVELEKSCNLLDLRYVPDTMDFSDTDEVDRLTELPLTHYHRLLPFETKALQHTHLQCSWDQDAPRNVPSSSSSSVKFSQGKKSKKELEDMDYSAYLASSSSEEDKT
ncbi:pre-rRNA-processing protein esf1 [Coelomomyces lativittatus]|nr:pre-rRNA-processing protein esf1 [Coelomomyces lativittatus]